MSKFVLSTATCGQRFTEYRLGENGGVHAVLREVLIRGGANSPSDKSGFGEMSHTDGGAPLWTPHGVVTKVSDEDAAFLAKHEGFQAAVKKGFYVVMDTDPGDSHKKIAAVVQSDMSKRDGSAPLNKEVLKTQVKVSTKLLVEED